MILMIRPKTPMHKAIPHKERLATLYGIAIKRFCAMLSESNSAERRMPRICCAGRRGEGDARLPEENSRLSGNTSEYKTHMPPLAERRCVVYR